MIHQVLIVGGTHGNELTGIYMVRKFQECPDLIKRTSFAARSLMGNPRAVSQVTRYLDKDLNRCFDHQAWSASASIYEEARAKNLLKQYGPKGETPTDFVIDLHSTTSNAGLMLILDHLDPFTLGLAAYLQAKTPAVKLYSSTGSGRENDSMRTLGKYRLGIEVGPLAHATLNADLFQKTEALIHHALDYADQHNCQYASPQRSPTQSPTQRPTQSGEPTPLTVYQYIGAIDYPKNNNAEMIAMTHPQRQFQDYEVVNLGDPMFLTFEGETISYEGKTPVYPIFINEAAYYEKGVAMSFTEKKKLVT